LENKLCEFNNTCGVIRVVLNKRASKEVQNKCDKTRAIPTLQYSTETWALIMKQRQNSERA
jgi:hypothetical protein